jgi:hypothetical protein
MNRITAILFAFLLLAAGAIGYAAEKSEDSTRKWEQYSKDRQGLTLFYEKDTIEYGTNGMIKVWRKREFPVRSQHKAIVTLDEIDCYKQKYRSHKLEVTGWDDSSEMFNRVAEWSTIYGDSPEEYFLDNACKELRKKSKK